MEPEEEQLQQKKVFNLKSDANLPMGVAPMIAKKAFEVEVHLEKQGDGILVAQGGDAHGWNLFMHEGMVHFTIRLGGKVETGQGQRETGGPRNGDFPQSWIPGERSICIRKIGNSEAGK